MSIENFLNDFDNQNDKLKADKEKKELELKLKIESQENFIKTYKTYFEQVLKNQLESIANKLSEKFSYQIIEPADFQGNNCLTELILESKFDHHIKIVKINFTTEGDRKLISLGANTEANHGKILGERHHSFQGNLDAFEKLNLEDEISKILNKIFIRK